MRRSKSNPWAAVHAEIEARTGKTVRQLLAEQQAARAPQGAAPLPPAAPAPARPTQRPRKPRVRIDLGPPNLPWSFTILGAPRTKGNSRSGFGTFPSASHRKWLRSALAQAPIIRAACKGTARVPVHVRAVFYRASRTGDLDNYLKALGDFLERCGLVWNDNLIASWDGSRLEVDRARPRIEVTVEEC